MSRSTAEWVVRSGSLISLLGLATAVTNLVGTPRLRHAPSRVTEPVTVCIPARDERDRLPALIGDLRSQRGVADLCVVVYDDASTDGTAAAAETAAGGDPRVVVVRGTAEPPPGWVGKQAACREASGVAARLRRERRGILVFLDADVRLHPDSLAASCAALRDFRADLLCPWPFQRARSLAEDLVQPLLAWSWVATLPVPVSNRSRRPSTTVSCGQFLVFDSAAYHLLGGHAAVATSLTEDLDIARAMRRLGMRTVLVAAGGFASCRMYDNAHDLYSGYGRWLWTAFGSRFGAAAVLATAGTAYLAPPVAMAVGHGRLRRWGAAGYLAAVASRLCSRVIERGGPITAREIAGAWAHPLSIVGVTALTVCSFRD
ncbi:MAG: glycosyltransferase family 2 protein, partial [Rhodococcus sp. (in: high G+C Gram-positive bacteria)]|uniref:glycosyltransferase n=1 Tax=Rhodococcus sp. TaxID=1831 RepID=UPI003BAF6254